MITMGAIQHSARHSFAKLSDGTVLHAHTFIDARGTYTTTHVAQRIRELATTFTYGGNRLAALRAALAHLNKGE